MKISFTYGVLITTFATFCYGTRSADEICPNTLDTWSSFEKYADLLRAHDLGDFVDNLKEIYELCDQSGKATYDEIHGFILYFSNIIDNLDNTLNDLEHCLEGRLCTALENCDEKMTNLRAMVDRTPETETCYKDLLSWSVIAKEDSYRRLDELDGKSAVNWEFYDTNMNIIENIRSKLTLDAVAHACDEVALEIHEAVIGISENYTSVLINMKETGENLDNLKSIQDEIYSEIKEEMEYGLIEMSEDLRDQKEQIDVDIGNLNAMLLDNTEQCDYMSSQMSSDGSFAESMTMTEINTIERSVSAKIYKVVDNERIPLGCEEYVPYFGMKPTEHFLSTTIHNYDVVFKVTGKNENNQYYTREYTKTTNDNEENVREIIKIKGEDTVLDREYVYVY